MANWGRIGSRGHVEDRRGFAPVIGGLSVTGLALWMIFNLLAGGDMGDVLGQLEQIPLNSQQSEQATFEGEDEYEVFASTIVGSNNDMWEMHFQTLGKQYNPPRLVLFRTATTSGCGTANSEVGPHYCPLDQTIYLDETFFEELQNRFGAQGGDVAESYVIAHEVAHHAQHQLGLVEQGRTNQGSINTELQADCFAGLWAHSIKHLEVLAPGEIREAMDAAAAVGDDRIQKRATGYVNPETWTHGSSQQRVNAFNSGYESGHLSRCL